MPDETADTLAAEAATSPTETVKGHGMESAPSSPVDVALGATQTPDHGERQPSPLPLPTIDRTRYELADEVGRGGLGRVLRARDLHLGRNVAIKELLGGGEPARVRFVREARITARLQHPAIVPIYEAGQSSAGPFYAMRLVAGRSFGEAIVEAKTLDARLALLPSVLAVCDAMAYAHEEHIIHRDLKPGNVLVGRFGETVVIDWGLAKDLRSTEAAEAAGPGVPVESADATVAGSLMGTPAYMAPEQARGDTVDERADVYSLGALLYHTLTGKMPHAGPTLDELLRKVMAGDIVPIREREPGVPPDLAAIVDKAMQLDSTHRYRTAQSLAEDLRRFQTGQLVNAHHYSAGERARRWLRRHRAPVGIAGAAVVVLAVLGSLALRELFAEQRATREQAVIADRAAAEATAQRDAANANAMLVRAQQYARTGHVAEEVAVLRALASGNGDAPRLALRTGGFGWKAHERLAMALGSGATTVLRSSDGSRFVAAVPGAIVAWDTRTGRELARMRVTKEVTEFPRLAAISPGGRFVLVLEPCAGCRTLLRNDHGLITAAGELLVRELATGRTVAQLRGGDIIDANTIAFADDDSAIAIARQGKLGVFDRAGSPQRERALVTPCSALAVARDGAAVAAACGAKLMLARGDGELGELARYEPAARQLVFAGPAVVAIGASVQTWDVATADLRGVGTLPAGVVAMPSMPMSWARYRDGVRLAPTPQIRRGDATVSRNPTSLLAASVLPTIGGAILRIDTPWQVLELRGLSVTDLLADSMLPPSRTERCMPFAAGQRHAVTVLDRGARLLVDEQELPARRPDDIAAIRYRTLTVDDAPSRQLRPAQTAETGDCLVWGDALGPHEAVADVTADDRIVAHGNGVIVLSNPAISIAPDGTATTLDTAVAPVASADGSYIASIHDDEARITAVTGNRIVRRWPVGTRSLAWVGREAVEASGDGPAMVVPVDPALPIRVREPELFTSPTSRYAARVIDGQVAVIRIADGTELVRHRVAAQAVRVLDDRGTIAASVGDRTLVLPPNGHELVLRGIRFDLLEPAGDYLLAGTVVWDLRDGRKIGLDGATSPILAGDEAWWISGGRLVRYSLRSGDRREVELSTAGLSVRRLIGELIALPDRRHVIGSVELGNKLRAIGIWDTETGDLMWVGDDGVGFAGGWVAEHGRVYRPRYDLAALIADTGARTNLRVCRGDLRAVPVSPPPPADSVWAPDEACGAERR